ncbi:MAG: DUF1326 domain-containing protein [Alphaproteobacteria bacterium]|nr:DUF1326 domain-containing protein [Alphaproteobacteria bacterium]
MNATAWQLEGEYFEACNCDFLCPCLVREKPTRGGCTVALIFHVRTGQYQGTGLDGLNFVLAAETPGPMPEGNWTVGVIVDQRASAAQRSALAAIAAGEVGGPLAGIRALTGRFAGTAVKPISYEADGLRRHAKVEDMLAVSIAGLSSPRLKGEAMWVENTGHSVSQRLALAKAGECRLSAFGIDWRESAGRNNGHFAPFRWSG